MEGLPATNTAILVTTGTTAATSNVLVQNLNINQLPPNQCMQTFQNGPNIGVETSGAQCGTGGGFAIQNSSIAVFTGTQLVTFPTSIINFSSSSFLATLTGGSTASITLQPTQVFSTVTVANLYTSVLHSSASVFNVSSMTVSGPLNVISTVTPSAYYAAIENPLVHISLTSAIGQLPGAQTEGLYVDFLDTEPVTNPLNDAVGIHVRARQLQGANGQLIGLLADTAAQDAGGPPSIAGQFVPGWVSDLPGGTTSTIIGIVIAPRITNLAGNVNLATGTLKALYIPDFTNGRGAPNQSWSIYSDASAPSFLNNFLGIGQQLPDAPLVIAVSTNTQYGIAIGTTPFNFYGTIPDSNYVFAVTNPGIVYNRGEIINGQVILTDTLTPAANPNALAVNYTTPNVGTARMVAIDGFATQTSSFTNALSIAVGVEGEAIDSPTANGSLAGIAGHVNGEGNGPVYEGGTFSGNWESNQVGGTTSTIIGVEINDVIGLNNSTTTLSTGTLKQLNIDDPLGSGAPNQSWAIFSNSRFPVFLNNFLGIGDHQPVSSLSVAVTTNTPYGVVVSSEAFAPNSGPAPVGNYTFTVTNNGNVTASGSMSAASLAATQILPVGFFPDPEAVTITGPPGNNRACLGFHTTTDDFFSSTPYEICRTGTQLNFGFKSPTGGMANFISFDNAGSYPSGSSVTINAALIATQGISLASVSGGNASFKQTGGSDTNSYQIVGSSADIVTVGDTAIFTSSYAVVDGGPPNRLIPKTIAQLHALTPAFTNLQYACSDCTSDAVAVSTGTTVGAFGEVGTKSTFPH